MPVAVFQLLVVQVMMCWFLALIYNVSYLVSVAGCLGYDVLGEASHNLKRDFIVSVAGCLGYDVLVWLKTLI